jgi:Ribosomal protein L36e
MYCFWCQSFFYRSLLHLVRSLQLHRGLKKGHKTEKTGAAKARPSRRKGILSNRVKVVREVIRDVAGLAPYEKRLLDVLKVS